MSTERHAPQARFEKHLPQVKRARLKVIALALADVSQDALYKRATVRMTDTAASITFPPESDLGGACLVMTLTWSK